MTNKKQRRLTVGTDVKLEMTPMIDVVFQLMSFFVVTFKVPDILADLRVTRPAPDPRARPEKQVEDLLQIIVWKDGYVLQGKKVTLQELDRQLSKVGSFNSNISVVIKCTGDSPHKYLVQLLDVCAKARLSKISVFSL